MSKSISTAEFFVRAEKLPRVCLGQLPTRMEELPRLSQMLGGPRIFMKRDDCTGLAFGGNKTRHNEFILGDAVAKKADMVVWGAGVQSNNCRQTAAACAKLGLGCHLVLTRSVHNDDLQGNLLLDYLLGATYEIVDAPMGPELDALIAKAAATFESQGHRVYKWDPAVVKSRAAISYAWCLAEIVDQCQSLGVQPAAVYACSAGSTGAGLALGRHWFGMTAPVRSIQPIRWPWDEREDLAHIANDAARLFGIETKIAGADIEITDAYVGSAYGKPTKEGMDAIALVARTEGILLDPSYTGKAMAALIADIRRGLFSPGEAVVFIHTGGTPALFAYRDELRAMIPAAR